MTSKYGKIKYSGQDLQVRNGIHEYPLQQDAI